MALREILVELGIEIDRNGAQRAQDAVGRLNTGLSSLKRVALAAGAIFLTGKLAQGFGNIVKEAGDAAEIASKFGAVFVEEAESVGAAVDDMAKRTGQSRIAIQEMAADAGALVKPLVGDTKAAGDLATQMAETALDIASFENVLPQEALGALRSAIIGSSEPMLRFGVDTRQAALQQFALDQGLKKSIKAMSSAEVTGLRMALVMDRLGQKGAVGDAERTAGSFSNRMKALDGVFADLRVEIGKEFLPVLTEFLGEMILLVREIGPGLAKAARGAAVVLKGFVTVFLSVARVLTRTEGILAVLAIVLGGLGLAFVFVGKAAVLAGLKAAAAWVIAALPVIFFIALLGLMAIAIFALVEDFILMGDGHESVTGTMIQGVQDLMDKYGDWGLVIGDVLDTALRFWLNFFGKSQDEAEDWIDNLTTTLMDFWPTVIEFWKGQLREFFDFVGKGIKGVIVSGLEAIGADETAAAVRRDDAGVVGRGALQAAASIIPGIGALAGAGFGAVSAAGVGANINQSTNVKIEVDATGNAQPEAVGDAVRSVVRDELEKRDRQTLDALTVAIAP